MTNIFSSTHTWAEKGIAVLVGVALVLSMVSLFVAPGLALAADTGFKSPTSTHSPNDFDTNAVANVQVSDNVYASDNDESQQGYSNFNFSIPAGSVIDGIEMQVEAKSSDNSGCRIEAELSWNNGSSDSNQRTASINNTDTLKTLGGPADDWGHDWSDTEFSNANFVAKVRIDDVSGNDCANNAVGDIDLLQVKVYYTEPVQPIENPPMPTSCGVDMALVIDSSGSINDTELGQMKTAFNAFVDAFLPATPTEMAVVEFDTDSSITQTFTDDATALHTAINAAVSGGSTNWEAALQDAHSLFPNRNDKPDVIVFASDGNPNVSSGPLSDLQDAIVEANAIKTDDIHIVALGIGGDLDAASLAALSYPDSVITSGFDTLADDLADLATTLCGGTITVHKIIDADGDLNTVDDQTNASGWTFHADVTSNGDSATPDSGLTDGDGLFTFDINLGEDDTAMVDVSEEDQSGFVPLAASCIKQGNGPMGTPGEGAVTGVAVGKADIISCTFYNTPAGLIIVQKQTEPDGSLETFEFVPSYDENFTLADDGENVSDELLPGTYSVTELAKSGWEQTGVVCSSTQEGDQSTADNISLSSGETVTCVFTNTEVPEEILACDVGDVDVTNVNKGIVVNGLGASASTGGNSAQGGNGGTGGNGGSVGGEFQVQYDEEEEEGSDDGSTGGAGGNGGAGGAGGVVMTGDAGAAVGANNTVNVNTTSIDRSCGCCGCGHEGGGTLGNDTVKNVNFGGLFNFGGVSAKTGKNATDGGTAGNGGTGGSVEGGDDNATAGAGGTGGAGGAGGTTSTGAAGAFGGFQNLFNINTTLIKR